MLANLTLSRKTKILWADQPQTEPFKALRPQRRRYVYLQAKGKTQVVYNLEYFRKFIASIF